MKKRILTGIRPTGKLHLGHYVGALENWIRLQEEYDCYFLIADYQALGDHIDEMENIKIAVRDVVLDWLSVGLDPDRSTFVVQSYVPEHAELAMLLSMLTPLGMLERNPTLKSERERISNTSLSVGFYTYPVSQVADILLPKADLVPVGEDQLPHIEMTREIARRFNNRYGNVFPEPDSLVGRVARLLGTDGQSKMSKSIGNVIYLSDDSDMVNKKIMSMYTDPTRLRATDPGHVEGNPVFQYHDAFNTNTEEVNDLKERYTQGKVGDVEVKQKLIIAINNFLDPIRENRNRYQNDPNFVDECINEGSAKGKLTAEKTMYEVRETMGLNYVSTNY
ncbi:MAG: tryptophan--tRNA ligase [Dehalococcoidia bacterium]